MTVWVDGLVFENPDQHGIWRVFYEVMRRTAGRVDYTLWLRARPERPLPPGVRVHRDVGRRHVHYKWDVASYLWRLSAQKRVPAGLRRADLFHSTCYSRPPAAVPEVLSLYDTIPERLYDICPGWADLHVGRKAACAAAAARCLAISAATAADAARFYPRLAGRTRVVPLGADHLAPAAPPPAGRERAALYVGHRGQYKNFRTVLDAMTTPRWPAGVGLWVAGTPFAGHELGLIRALGLAGRVAHRGRVSDAELAGLYAAAGCFVYPSLLEGFGLPLLEAQLNGCPVACSDIPAFREVAGEAAAFFDPRLAEAVADGVAAAVGPAAGRLAEAGRENVRRYTWDRTAADTVAGYQEAVAAAAAGA